LATKGFSTGQISRIFLLETILIGTVGALLGVVLGLALTPLFAASSAGGFQFNLATINPYTVVFTIAFGLIMAFLSTYSSSKRAAKLSTVGALREYLPVEPQQSYRKRVAWLCLILGTYKIVAFIAGINVQTLVSRAVFGGGNFILTLLGGIWIIIDTALNYVGPLLFFYGFAKLFIQGSLKFQELTVRASKFLGDIGTLATKNVRRKPARAAAMAFLIALIVWYGVSVTGQLAVERDYSTRSVYANVGADVTAEIANVTQTQAILQNVLANVSGVKGASAEYSINTVSGNMQLKAVDPDLWLKTAYYEQGWFSGATVDEAFAAMKADNETIVLDQSQAKNLDVGMGDLVSVQFENATKSLRVVGLFGPKPQDSSSSFGFGVASYYSFVPYNLYAYPGNLTSASARLLVKADGSLDGQTVADNVRNVDGVITVNSVSKSLELAQTNVLSTGTLEVQQLGIIFAVLAASVGTALISVVSMRERAREATIMSVKGLSYKQLVVMFLTESFALVTLSILLGAAIGFISVYGNVSSANAQTPALVMRQFIFPLDSALLIVGCIALIFAATILLVIIMSRKYVTQLEKMVRIK
jgi:ABC-type antimicrobial peptide transport system permease subunit